LSGVGLAFVRTMAGLGGACAVAAPEVIFYKCINEIKNAVDEREILICVKYFHPLAIRLIPLNIARGFVEGNRGRWTIS
jgi:hypothetical protein